MAAKGFDVTFVYFGSNSYLTSGTEDCAVVVMRTFEHVKNFQFTATHEEQFREGNASLSLAYPNAEIFKVVLFEDLDVDGIPDGQGGNSYTDMSGGSYGGRSGGSGILEDYWIYAYKFVESGTPLPTPSPEPTPQPTTTSTPTPQSSVSTSPEPSTTPSPTETVNPTPTLTPTPSLEPTPTPTETVNPTIQPTPTPLAVEEFKIESNSTVSSIGYNSTAKEIRFQVSGETNTSGYIKITITKTFMPNSNIDVYVDGNKIDCEVSSDGDSWLVTFSYKHSMHQVVINSQVEQNVSAAPDWLWQVTIIIVAIGIIIGVSVVVWLGKFKSETPKT